MLTLKPGPNPNPAMLDCGLFQDRRHGRVFLRLGLATMSLIFSRLRIATFKPTYVTLLDGPAAFGQTGKLISRRVGMSASRPRTCLAEVEVVVKLLLYFLLRDKSESAETSTGG